MTYLTVGNEMEDHDKSENLLLLALLRNNYSDSRKLLKRDAASGKAEYNNCSVLILVDSFVC